MKATVAAEVAIPVDTTDADDKDDTTQVVSPMRMRIRMTMAAVQAVLGDTLSFS